MHVDEPIKILFNLKSTYIILILVLFCNYTFCQSTKITGSIKDMQGKSIANANITIIDTVGKILLFKFSDNEGNFSFQLSDTILVKKGLKLQINVFGYARNFKSLENGKINYLFLLANEQLKEVNIVGVQRVKRKGDTTSFSVKAFSGKEDRSIGDVIAKIPGMSVEEDGKIKYKNKEIKGLYIHGDDLLSENYGIGTNVISKEMIKSIEVIERFQPIRVLKDKVGTNDVALNLVLQDENVLNITGQVSAGFGSPGLLDLSANEMLFNKKIKGLAVVKHNNTGNSFVSSNFEDLLIDGMVDNPGVPDKYINKNNSFLANGNFLFSLKDSLQFKSNIQFSNDRNSINFSALNTNFLDIDTITYNENRTAIRKPYVFSLILSLEQNKASRYLTDRLVINYGGITSQSTLLFNNRNLQQLLNSGDRNISNQLIWMPVFKKQNSYSVDWKFKYQELPQSLNIEPGVESVLLNNNIDYKSAFQDVKKKAFNNELVFNYFINDKKLIRKSFALGISNEFQSLYSRININQFDGSSNLYLGDYGNDLNWQKHNEYIKLGFFIRKQNFNAQLSIPFELQQISLAQVKDESKKNHNNVFVNPSVLLKYFFNSKNSIDFNYSLNNTFGTINNIYTGTILRNFKELRSNSNDIQELRQHKINFGYTFNNALKLLDVTTGISYVHKRANTIYSTKYERDILTTFLLPFRADQSTISYQASLSKYIYFLKSKLELSTEYAQSLTDQFVNDVSLPYVNKNWNTRLTAGCSLMDYVSLYYSGSANLYSSNPKEKLSNVSTQISKVVIYNHNYSLVITPKLPLNIVLQGRQQINNFYSNSKTSYFFADLMLRYHANKQRIDFEIDFNNLFNVETFGTYYITTNQLFSSSYQLRGSLILLKANFNF